MEHAHYHPYKRSSTPQLQAAPVTWATLSATANGHSDAALLEVAVSSGANGKSKKKSRGRQHTTCVGCRAQKSKCDRRRNCSNCVLHARKCEWRGAEPLIDEDLNVEPYELIQARQEVERLRQLSTILLEQIDPYSIPYFQLHGSLPWTSPVHTFSQPQIYQPIPQPPNPLQHVQYQSPIILGNYWPPSPAPSFGSDSFSAVKSDDGEQDGPVTFLGLDSDEEADKQGRD